MVSPKDLPPIPYYMNNIGFAAPPLPPPLGSPPHGTDFPRFVGRATELNPSPTMYYDGTSGCGGKPLTVEQYNAYRFYTVSWDAKVPPTEFVEGEMKLE
jgi:hypothetical protein